MCNREVRARAPSGHNRDRASGMAEHTPTHGTQASPAGGFGIAGSHHEQASRARFHFQCSPVDDG